MDCKTRLILPILMSGAMVLAVTLIVTYLNLGAAPDFVARWLCAYFVAWPIAAATGIVALPHLQRATAGLVRRLERRG
ncbi:MAG: DUF2798 domain-containing protein [Planctomycetes bacterium]|nr:DUF2798 domain-containing protein [Planctomycetota bacterium]